MRKLEKGELCDLVLCQVQTLQTHRYISATTLKLSRVGSEQFLEDRKERLKREFCDCLVEDLLRSNLIEVKEHVLGGVLRLKAEFAFIDKDGIKRIVEALSEKLEKDEDLGDFTLKELEKLEMKASQSARVCNNESWKRDYNALSCAAYRLGIKLARSKEE